MSSSSSVWLDYVEAAVTLIRFLITTLIGSVRACLPCGVQKRKAVNGEICLITGAGSGIGRLMAQEFAKLGCTVVIWDVNEEGGKETTRLIQEQGGKCVEAFVYKIDLSNRHEINATAEKVKKEVGEVDILINNAGIVTGKKIFECSDELMEKTMAVNANACMFTTKNFLRGMIDRNHGHIVTISSAAGRCGSAGLVDYCASKFAAVGFHESVAAELTVLGKTGVKTTLVCPYFINTGMFDGVKIKWPRLLPLLEPTYVSSRVVEAILTDQVDLIMPRFLYLTYFLASFLPHEAKMILAEYFGAYEMMDTFEGRNGTSKKIK